MPMSLFGRALTDFYHNSLKGPFYICDKYGEYELNLSFYFIISRISRNMSY